MEYGQDNFETDKRENSDRKNRKKEKIDHGVAAEEQIKQVTYTVQNKIRISLIN
jgi:hypothetical protein